MTRVAAIDCGTNSIRLLIAEQDPTGRLVDLDRRLEIVRLGQGVDATGHFHPDALARTLAAVDSYGQLIEAAGVSAERIHFVATSAARDARNHAEFFGGVEQRLGVVPDVISGELEGQLSFTGALSRVRPTAGPVLVMDIGGGSTELIMGSAEGEIEQAVSLDIGSVRITERFLPTSPPRPDDLERASRFIDGRLTQSAVDISSVGTWIGVAGTATTVAAVCLGLPSYDRVLVHGSVIPKAQIAQLLAKLSSLTVDEIRAIPSMHPQRADVITAGTLIAARVASVTSATELVVSESDILDGVALNLLPAANGMSR
ncbi:MAG: Ppx/GppA family phosphatase [Propionibacteriaceae bacterium]|nr:Ppx/GppA family phosphatase [Propionibacteriaceae bacterium]